ncbi:acetylxylan esterase [Streptomyces sp. NBC_00059]|uniref:acetylxylan esterase n=1 Tax=Streptomyces sp. NBC_00059 TaxID=2975635 RepID=UPI00225A22EB|nr:acetylxylan esterase [Streptomyces sp. NBC_00059]MCX5414844.1 acetylxylan esterase [Streptomyces sp. NBC_00059]
MSTHPLTTDTGELSPLPHDLPFDPTHGYDLPRLLEVKAPPEPDDFADFWQERYASALGVDTAPRIEGPWATVDGVRVADISYMSTDGVRIGGWLTVPADGRVTQGCVSTHGYGGREAPDSWQSPPGTATIWPCLRGLGTRSLLPGVPSNSAGHVLHGIGARESYLIGGCVADVWCAATALRLLVPEAAGRLTYLGTSFGGGIGALALPWDDRFQAAGLTVPTFGNHPLRVTLPCTGSGESVRTRLAEDPSVLDVLAYFDAATAARHLEIPVHVGAALFDPAVPPPGQFAVYNALAGPRELVVLRAGHFDHPGERAETAALEVAQRHYLSGTDPVAPRPTA